MNSAAPSLPGFRSLYHLDRPIRRAANTFGFGLLFAAGIQWVTAPQPNAVVKVVHSPLEVWVMQWGAVVGLMVSALALLVLVRRYLWLRRVLSRGTAIKGTVEDVDIYTREAESSSSTPIFQRAKIRTCYARIRYSWQGVDHTVRLHLPFSPSTHQLFKGRDTDLLVLPSHPDKPLLRTVYLERVHQP